MIMVSSQLRSKINVKAEVNYFYNLVLPILLLIGLGNGPYIEDHKNF